MDRSRDELFAGSCLAGDEHGCGTPRNLRDSADDRGKPVIRPDQFRQSTRLSAIDRVVRMLSHASSVLEAALFPDGRERHPVDRVWVCANVRSIFS